MCVSMARSWSLSGLMGQDSSLGKTDSEILQYFCDSTSGIKEKW